MVHSRTGFRLGALFGRSVALLAGLLGAALAFGGVQLILVGGSLYYAVAGVLLMVDSALIWRESRWSLPLYGAVLLITALWSAAEVGLDAWGWAPRLGLLLALGLAVALASARREKGGQGAKATLAVLLVAIVLLVFGISRTAMQAGPAGAVDSPAAAAEGSGEWPQWGGDPGGSRFASLNEITPANVGRLKPLWTYRTGDVGTAAGSLSKLTSLTVLEATPLKIGDSLYLCTAFNAVVALDAETGKERWRSADRVPTGIEVHRTCRGVSYHADPAATGFCAARVYHGTSDGGLWALDAATGRPCPAFGGNGSVDLRDGLGSTDIGYHMTSPGVIAGGNIVVGAWVSDNQSVLSPSGVIRAYDLRTGRLSWAWDMGHPERTGAPPAGESYTPGTPNAWAPMSADEALGLIYAPLGNPTPDIWGGRRRPFDDKYSSSIVALDMRTGHPRWSFQTLHHDVWDFDVPSQPVLVDIPTASGIRPGLVQSTKAGNIFVLDRRTGEPILPVTERHVPPGQPDGDRLSPTQPFSALSVGVPPLREADMWGISPLDQLWCRIQFRRARYDGRYTAPGTTPWINSPGAVGATSWGGVTVDRARHRIVVNSTNVAFYMQLLARGDAPVSARRRSRPVGYEYGPMEGTPYVVHVRPFLSPLRVPCNAPPWGFLQAFDLATGKTAWRRSFGSARNSGPLGYRTLLPLPIGVPSQGGAMTTGSGLTFIGASADATFRAFSTETGAELWRATLPASAASNPMTYRAPRSGRQIVVIAAGGHAALATRPGDYILAYALPR